MHAYTRVHQYYNFFVLYYHCDSKKKKIFKIWKKKIIWRKQKRKIGIYDHINIILYYNMRNIIFL